MRWLERTVGLMVLVVAVTLATPARASDDATNQFLNALRCACMKGGERVFSETSPPKTLLDCPCDDDGHGGRMRERVERYMSIQQPEEKESRAAQIRFLETISEEDPSNARYAIYSHNDHEYLMKNTLCTCGCGKMALSQCPLDCPWSPRFKRLFQFLLAVGHDIPEARAYYTDEANKVHRTGDEPLLTPNDVLLNQESAFSWGFPVVLFTILLLGLAVVVKLAANRSQAPSMVSPGGQGDLSDSDRALLEDELDLGE